MNSQVDAIHMSRKLPKLNRNWRVSLLLFETAKQEKSPEIETHETHKLILSASAIKRMHLQIPLDPSAELPGKNCFVFLHRQGWKAHPQMLNFPSSYVRFLAQLPKIDASVCIDVFKKTQDKLDKTIPPLPNIGCSS